MTTDNDSEIMGFDVENRKSNHKSKADKTKTPRMTAVVKWVLGDEFGLESSSAKTPMMAYRL